MEIDVVMGIDTIKITTTKKQNWGFELNAMYVYINTFHSNMKLKLCENINIKLIRQKPSIERCMETAVRCFVVIVFDLHYVIKFLNLYSSYIF